MYKITKNGQIVGFTELDPILNDGELAELVDYAEYEAWVEANKPKEPHFVTFEIPYALILGSQELKNKLVDIRLAYSQMETITKDGITYLSHIDITDVKEYLSKEEFAKFKGAGIKFPPEVEALFADKPKNEKPTA
ncbi:MAG: hypothetical protein HG424_000915 [candidate division SR1 bacterium]|nr:hypothetical protein [candidate division SR1 bacterium]